MRLLSSQGEVVRGRCRATNLCPYCATLFAVETSEMLALDALEHAPALYVVLTARELLDRADCYAHLRQLRARLRKRWPAIEWACLVEFQRRGALHLNLLVKGVPAGDVDELHERACRVWCSRVDAEPQAQFVGEISNAGGIVRYVTQHFMKPAQAPPIGWRGHRYSATRGYLVRPAAVMREEARASLRSKRALRAAIRAGHSPHSAELAVHEALELAARTSWRLYVLPLDALAPGQRERSSDERERFKPPAPPADGEALSAPVRAAMAPAKRPRRGDTAPTGAAVAASDSLGGLLCPATPTRATRARPGPVTTGQRSSTPSPAAASS